VLDCEDGVALNRKQDARENLRKLYDIDERIQDNSDNKYAVRINPAQTELAEQDIRIIFSISESIIKNNSKKKPLLNYLPNCVFVPKTNSSGDVKWLFEKLDLQLNSIGQLKQLSFFFYMESALSLLNLRDLIETAVNLSSNKYKNRYTLEGFVFGSDDFCADIGASRTKDASELAYARQKLVTYCKAYKLKAIDMVYIDFKGNTFLIFIFYFYFNIFFFF
jgi:citrate lyase subunit beta-like protein